MVTRSVSDSMNRTVAVVALSSLLLSVFGPGLDLPFTRSCQISLWVAMAFKLADDADGALTLDLVVKLATAGVLGVNAFRCSEWLCLLVLSLPNTNALVAMASISVIHTIMTWLFGTLLVRTFLDQNGGRLAKNLLRAISSVIGGTDAPK